MIVIERTKKQGKYNYMNPVCMGFEQSDVNEKGQLIVPEGICEIDIFYDGKDFRGEVDEIVLPSTLTYISKDAFKNIRAKCIDFSDNVPTHVQQFVELNPAIETVKLFGDKTIGYDFHGCPNLKKLVLKGGDLLYGYQPDFRSIETLEIADGCGKSAISLMLFKNLKEIKFPKKFNPNLTIYYADSAIRGLSSENLLQLLQYCPGAYLAIDQKICDESFIYNAKNVITNGMAARQQAKNFENVDKDIEMLKRIKTKMKNDSDSHLTAQGKFLDAMREFHK